MTRIFDLIVASVVLIGSASATLYFHQEVLRDRLAQSTTLDFTLPSGVNSFDILSENRCVGSVNLEITKDRATVLTSNAKINVKVGSTISELLLKVVAEFNPLGQLVLSRTDVSFNEIVLTIHSRYARPIKLNFHASGPTFDKTFATDVSGPLLLEQIHPQAFAVNYVGIASDNFSFLQGPLNGIRRELMLEVSPSGVSNSNCAPSKITNLDLTSLVSRYRGLLPFAENF